MGAANTARHSPRMMTLHKEVVSFTAVGLLQILVDWAVFVGLTHLGVPVVPSNISGRVSGALLGFSLNGIFTFGRPDGVIFLGRIHFLRFLTTWVATTIVSTACVTLLHRLDGLHAAWLGKPMIDAALAGAGFLASKYWIYK